MEQLRKQNRSLFNLLDQVATDQHNRLLSSLLEQLTPYMKGSPSLLIIPAAKENIKALAEAAVDLEMRGKTPERVDFGGYTLVVPLHSDFPFDTIYLTRPFTNKLKLTAFPPNPPIYPSAIWVTMDPAHPGLGPTGFDPHSAFITHRGSAPRLPQYIQDPHELIMTTVLLRESLETSPYNPQVEANLRKVIPYPIEEEVGHRFFPPLQVVSSGADDLLRPESYLLRLPIVPLIITHAPGQQHSLIQLETVPQWPEMWDPQIAFAEETDRVVLIGEGIDYDVSVLLTLMKDLVEASTAPDDYLWAL